MTHRRDEFVLGAIGILRSRTQLTRRPQGLLQLHVGFLALGLISHDFDEAVGAAVRITGHGHCAARPETSTILAHVPALIQRPSTRCSAPELLFRNAIAAILGREQQCHRLAKNVPGQRSEEVIDWTTMAALFDRLTQMQPTALQSHREAWPNDVNVIGLDSHPILNLNDLHGRTTTENVGHQALMLGRKMLDDHVRHAAVGGGRREERLQCLDAARRGPHAYDRERI